MSDRKRDRIFILNDPHALRVSGELAQEIGLNESIVLLQIEFLISISDNERDGQRWTYQSIRDLQRNYFPWWSIATINRTIESLEEKRLLTLGNYNKAKYDRTRWLALNMDGIGALESVRVFHALFQNETRSAQNETRSAQNETRSAQDETTIPETTTETTSQITSETTDSAAPKPRRERAVSSPKPANVTPQPKQPRISDLPAAIAYREITHLWPPAAAYADLEPISNGKLEAWCEVVKAWLMAGNSPRNVGGMLEWLRSGKRDNRGNAKAAQQSKVDAAVAWKAILDR